MKQDFVYIYDYDKDWVWSFSKQRSFNLKHLALVPASAIGDFSWMTQGRIFPSTFDELIEYMGGENYINKSELQSLNQLDNLLFNSMKISLILTNGI